MYTFKHVCIYIYMYVYIIYIYIYIYTLSLTCITESAVDTASAVINANNTHVLIYYMHVYKNKNIICIYTGT